MRRLLPLTLIALAACSGSSSPSELVYAGNSALGSGDASGARSSFDEALAAIGDDRSDPLYFEAKLGSIEAQAALDSAAARTAFLALADELPDQVDDGHFSLVGSRLGDARAFDDAVAVLEAGMLRHPESPHLQKLMSSLGDAATQAGATGALKSLQGLGYVGDE